MPPRPCSSDTAAHGGEWGGKYRGRFLLDARNVVSGPFYSLWFRLV